MGENYNSIMDNYFDAFKEKMNKKKLDSKETNRRL